jgi:hypothetical protein
MLIHENITEVLTEAYTLSEKTQHTRYLHRLDNVADLEIIPLTVHILHPIRHRNNYSFFSNSK